jgi:signal transduction histidine kinase
MPMTNPAASAHTIGDRFPFLGSLPLLRDLPVPELERIARVATRRMVPAGGVVMEEGTEGDGLYIVVDGELEVSRRDGEGEVVLAIQGPGAFLGEMSLLERAPRSATVRAVRPSELLIIPVAGFHDLLATSPTAGLTLLRTFANRLRSTEAVVRQSAKLASLGTLAAGLAHELNNPASALARGTLALDPAIEDLDRCARRIGELGLGSELRARLDRMGGSEALASAARSLAALNRAEDELTGWLDRRGFDRPVAMAGPLALCGWTPDRMEMLVDGLDSGHDLAILEWVAARCALAALGQETRTAASAITDVVEAVKAHTHLGQAPVQTIRVPDGLETTLVLLRGRFGPEVEVVRDFEPDLPAIEAYGGELNQVWANLIDNALQAMGDRGTLELRTAARGEGVMVEVVDSGPGIAPEVLPRIFDPFYTTKPVGTGTGLGLHVAYTVVRRHGGQLRVTSRPGRTAFTVELPLRLLRPVP